jgi:aspartate kinase
MKVSKFGGTSVASAEQIKKVATIIQSDPTRKFVVVSAPGKRFNSDKKVTDLLIELANAALNLEETETKLQQVLNRYREIAIDLRLDQTICED